MFGSCHDQVKANDNCFEQDGRLRTFAGELKVGAKVAVQYRRVAVDVEVKDVLSEKAKRSKYCLRSLWHCVPCRCGTGTERARRIGYALLVQSPVPRRGRVIDDPGQDFGDDGGAPAHFRLQDQLAGDETFTIVGRRN